MSPGADSLGLSGWPVAIVAGGLAKRLRPKTDKIPKALVTVAGQPFLAHQLHLLKDAGIRKVVLCVGYLGDMIEARFGDGAQLGLELKYSYDGPHPLGTGGAVRNALEFLGDQFFVLYGDSYLPIDYGAPARAFLASGKRGLMTVFRNEGRWDTSNVWFAQGVIRRYDKEELSAEMKHIDYGLGLFRREAFTSQRTGRAFDLSEVYRELIARDQLAGYEVEQRFYEIGSPEGWAELDALLRKQESLVQP
ncbi:MAG TPA: nucleotidyltransferase family protein [Verrucomicrobiae bacterium]|nr:nucleotidyltransferase family protein [Verrucomicrobiae bacterium]